jgi:hypothetical protein
MQFKLLSALTDSFHMARIGTTISEVKGACSDGCVTEVPQLHGGLLSFEHSNIAPKISPFQERVKAQNISLIFPSYLSWSDRLIKSPTSLFVFAVVFMKVVIQCSGYLTVCFSFPLFYLEVVSSTRFV